MKDATSAFHEKLTIIKKDIQENTKIDPKVDLQMDLRTEEVKCGEVKKNKNKLMDFFAKKT